MNFLARQPHRIKIGAMRRAFRAFRNVPAGELSFVEYARVQLLSRCFEGERRALLRDTQCHAGTRANDSCYVRIAYNFVGQIAVSKMQTAFNQTELSRWFMAEKRLSSWLIKSC